MLNQLKTILLVALLSAIVLGIGALVAPGHLYVFGALAVVLNLGAYFFSDRLVLRLHHARELHVSEAPELHHMLTELARNAGIPRPKLYLIPEAQPNAFATGRSPAHGVVAVTSGIVEILTPRELRAVLAHEIAHIKNRDILVSSIAATLTSVVTWAAHALSFSALFGGSSGSDRDEGASGPAALLLAFLAPIGATLVQLGISRSREHLADETGARISGDPRALASALVKLERGAELVPAELARPATASLFIVNPLTDADSVSQLFSTHPATRERVRRLMQLAHRAEQRPSASLPTHFYFA